MNNSMRRLGNSALTQDTDVAAVWGGVVNNQRQMSAPLAGQPLVDRRASMNKKAPGNAMLRRLSSSCRGDWSGGINRRVDMRRISALSGSFHSLDDADLPDNDESDFPQTDLIGEGGFVAVMTMDLKDAPTKRGRANSWDSTHHSKSSGLMDEFEDELSRGGASALVSFFSVFPRYFTRLAACL